MQEETTPVAPVPLLRTKDGEDFDIPEEGSLGLLALGYVGLMAWRQKRHEVKQQKTSTNSPVSNETPR